MDLLAASGPRRRQARPYTATAATLFIRFWPGHGPSRPGAALWTVETGLSVQSAPFGVFLARSERKSRRDTRSAPRAGDVHYAACVTRR